MSLSVFKQYVEGLRAGLTPPEYFALKLACESWETEVNALQAKIDALMLEYCPEEMTKEQLDNWASHQKAVRE